LSEHKKLLDTSGLNCPLPIIRAKKALDKLQSGDELKIISTDPGSPKDFEEFANQYGHVLEESSEDRGSFYYRIKKA